MLTSLVFGIKLYSQQNYIPAQKQAELKELESSADRYRREGDLGQTADFYNKIAHIYWSYNYLDDAAIYYKNSLDINKELGNSRAIGVIYTYLGRIYAEKNQNNQALTYFSEAEPHLKKFDVKNELFSYYVNLANVYGNLRQTNNEIQNIYTAIELALEINSKSLLKTCYGKLADAYNRAGKSDSSFLYLQKYTAFEKDVQEDRIEEMTAQKDKQISLIEDQVKQVEMESLLKDKELQKRADSLIKAKRQAELYRIEQENSQLKVAQKEEELKRKMLTIYSLIAGIALVAIFSIILIRQINHKKSANRRLLEQNRIIQEKNIQINDSIRYAQRIQQSILPVQSAIAKVFDVFILFRPKDIVSGDFYWYCQVLAGTTTYNYIATVDCTGHGVPGAFMSLIGNRLLNQIIIYEKQYDPKVILERLNTEVQNALKQDVTDSSDGMDICLCRLEKLSNGEQKLVYAGAKRPLFYYQKGDKEIAVIKGDRKSIGGLPQRIERSFTNHELHLRKGDMLYLTTDGLIDQNGADRKRFGAQRFTETLLGNINQTVEQQKQTLVQALDDYQNGEEQRDDITVIGIRV